MLILVNSKCGLTDEEWLVHLVEVTFSEIGQRFSPGLDISMAFGVYGVFHSPQITRANFFFPFTLLYCFLTFPILSSPSLCPLPNETNQSLSPTFATIGFLPCLLFMHSPRWGGGAICFSPLLSLAPFSCPFYPYLSSQSNLLVSHLFTENCCIGFQDTQYLICVFPQVKQHNEGMLHCGILNLETKKYYHGCIHFP